MPRNCTICNHPQLKEITHALMARRPYRSIQARYGVNKSAIVRHLKRHVTKALRKLTAAEIPRAMAEEVAEPVWEEMQKLKVRSLAHSQERRRRERPYDGALCCQGMPAESGVDCEADGRA